MSAFDYKQIATVPFAQLAARYKVQYGINLDLNGTIDTVAQRVEELNKGARPIFTYLESLNDKLLNEVVLQKLNSGSRNIKYRVSFENDKFNLERLDGNKILCEEDSSGQEAADNKLTVAKNNEEILSGEGNPSETNMMADKSTAEEDNAAKKNSKAE